MAIEVFGVTYTTVRQDYFPHFTGEFSATTKPSSSRVTEYIKEEAADISGKLRLKGTTAAAIAALTSDADPYVWCRKTLGLLVASRVAKVMSGADPDYAKALAAEAKARLTMLEENGVEALGAGTSVADSTDEVQGPTGHIDDLDLETDESETDLVSDVAPVLRRGDLL